MHDVYADAYYDNDEDITIHRAQLLSFGAGVRF